MSANPHRYVWRRYLGVTVTHGERWRDGWSVGRLDFHRMSNRAWFVRSHALRLGHWFFIWGKS
jgi:hypothetical protein